MRTAIVVLAFCAFLSVVSSVSAAPSHIHMTWTGDPRHTIVISWATGGDEASLVEYGVQLPYTKSASGPAGKIHHVTLEGLEPDTVYHFRCGSESGWSDDLTFKTAPDGEDPFTFVALGDSRTNWAIWGDCSEAVLATNPDFFLHTGDLVSSGGDQSEWNIWFDEAEQLLASKVMMPSIGNHEGNDPKYYQQFALPGAKDWYSFDYGNAHFIALSTERPMTGAQRQWLESDLASTNATWKFVYYHKPMYSSSSHGGEKSVRQAWEDLFDKYGVDMVFNGHDHCYERSYPMFDEWLADPPESGTIHVVTGAAGAPLYGLVAQGPWSARFASQYHFVVLRINRTELHFEARFFNQTVFDEMHISKSVLPDLQVTDLRSDPRYPIPAESAVAMVRVENRGRASSPGADLTVLVDSQPAGVLRMGSLEPGGVEIIQVSLPTLATGVHNLTAVADSGGEVHEGWFEQNNRLDSALLVSEPRPDLEVGEILSSSLMPAPGEQVMFSISIHNSGSAPVGEFQVKIELSDQVLISWAHEGLKAGAYDQLEVAWTCEAGDWDLEVTLDPAGVVDELFEANNFGSGSFIFSSFMKDGPTYLPQGFSAGEKVVVYYDLGGGAIPADSQGCVAVWGMNGWKRPPRESAPPNTMMGTVYQTQMVSVSDSLYAVEIQTTLDFEWIDLKFYDRQALPRWEDTNNGSFWIVPSGQWASGKLSELVEAIHDAEQVGVNTTTYWAVVANANSTLLAGRYLEAAQVMMAATEECRYDECIRLIEAARRAYEEALQEGLEVSRANSFLGAAEVQLERGNYYGSKTYSLKSLEYIEQTRAQAPEWLPAMGLLLTLPVLRRASHARTRRHREH